MTSTTSPSSPGHVVTHQSNLHAMLFHFEFDDLRRAYRSSIASFEAASENAEATVRRMYGLAQDEPFPEVEPDEEGYGLSFDWGELVGEIEHDARSSKSLVRTAFVIALFHFWERETNRWRQMKGKTYDHRNTMLWLTAKGITPEDATLHELELSAHCAKHGPGRSCNQLFALRPDFFDFVPSAQSAFPDESDLRITDDLANAFFDAVAKSGPRLHSPF